ncbi:MAG: matrixin family metalloprotease [Pseudomonadales bacterium]|nr:matrixin family metalloprotease [Pseudomonadales bacterium]
MLKYLRFCICLSLFWAVQLNAFEFTGSKWLGAQTDYYVDLEGISPTGIAWNTAFIDAMEEWTNETIFDFNLITEFKDPCESNGFNGVNFTTDICGQEFGENTLAVAIRTFRFEQLGPPSIREADIYFKDSVVYDIYDGNIVQFGIPTGSIDFQRTALHELGHVIGLDHEQFDSAIMRPEIGNIDRLQEDDIEGVDTLYSGLSNCAIKELRFGAVNESLSSGDCTVDELTLGDSDASFLDIYQFSLTETTELEFSIASNELESVLLLADQELDYIDADTNTANDCNSNIEIELDEGEYFLLVNTFTDQVKPACNTTGSYQLIANYISTNEVSLSGVTSLTGNDTTALFSGGITANGGISYGNIFTANDSLDITATISIDPVHQSKIGYIVIAAVVGQEIYLMNSLGQFVLSSESPGEIINTGSRILGTTENIVIAEDLIPSSLGIEEIVVDFVVGYGTFSNPSEVYFHQSPINLTVVPE